MGFVVDFVLEAQFAPLAKFLREDDQGLARWHFCRDREETLDVGCLIKRLAELLSRSIAIEIGAPVSGQFLDRGSEQSSLRLVGQIRDGLQDNIHINR